LNLNPSFVKKVAEIRESTDYGSEKLHFVLKKSGFGVSQHIIQRILNEEGLTNPCPKLRGRRKYVRYQWLISNYMWHCDWSQYEDKWHISFIDDRSRKIMGSGEFTNATEENAIFLFYQAMLTNEVCPVIVLSDKGTQFYNSKRNKNGVLIPSLFEQELDALGMEFRTSRRNHPQINGKMEKWFDTFSIRQKQRIIHI
jgi:transposase InsO family protein